MRAAFGDPRWPGSYGGASLPLGRLQPPAPTVWQLRVLAQIRLVLIHEQLKSASRDPRAAIWPAVSGCFLCPARGVLHKSRANSLAAAARRGHFAGRSRPPGETTMGTSSLRLGPLLERLSPARPAAPGQGGSRVGAAGPAKLRPILMCSPATKTDDPAAQTARVARLDDQNLMNACPDHGSRCGNADHRSEPLIGRLMSITAVAVPEQRHRDFSAAGCTAVRALQPDHRAAVARTTKCCCAQRSVRCSIL